MIERVARVLCRFTWETQFGKQDLDACVDQEWPNHTDAARLSIEAMREPTRKMLSAGGFYHITGAGSVSESDMEIAKREWQSMIAAALE